MGQDEEPPKPPSGGRSGSLVGKLLAFAIDRMLTTTTTPQPPSEGVGRAPSPLPASATEDPPYTRPDETAPALASTETASDNIINNNTDVATRILEAIHLDQRIPKDPEALRQTPLFRQTYEAIQWQRDQYLVGTEYAQWRRFQREKHPEDSHTRQNRPISSYELPRDLSSALGPEQIAQLGSRFLPSATVQQALLPLVTQLPQGALYQPTKNGLINVIMGQEANLNQLAKTRILAFLTNPQNRKAIKSSTQGYIATNYTDATMEPPPSSTAAGSST